MFMENQLLTNRKKLANKSEILKNEEMTFNPSINKRSKEIMMEKENQQNQQENCDENSQLTTSNKLKRSKSVTTTTTDRLFNYAKIKSDRLRDREIKEKLKKTEGLTFKPKLNKTSMKLVNEMSEDNETEESVYNIYIIIIIMKIENR